ncbi:MAG: phage tail protein, partial [Spirochaetia bacterium]
MPVTPTYPGVYIQEEPSGVRTIVGISTSVAAFVGQAPTGPVNEAVRVYNFSEYQRAFGGLHQKSEMSYAVRQFFRNGGGEAWIVRVAKNARASSTKLKNTGGQDVLEIKALNPGPEGDKIEVRVDYDGTGTGNEFNLRIKYVDEINPKNNKEE